MNRRIAHCLATLVAVSVLTSACSSSDSGSANTAGQSDAQGACSDMQALISKVEADPAVLGTEGGAQEVATLADSAKTKAQAAAKANADYVELSEKVLTALTDFRLPLPQAYQDVSIWCQARGL